MCHKYSISLIQSAVDSERSATIVRFAQSWLELLFPLISTVSNIITIGSPSSFLAFGGHTPLSILPYPIPESQFYPLLGVSGSYTWTPTIGVTLHILTSGCSVVRFLLSLPSTPMTGLSALSWADHYCWIVSCSQIGRLPCRARMPTEWVARWQRRARCPGASTGGAPLRVTQ